MARTSFLLASVLCGTASALCPIQNSTTVAVFKGTGAASDCVSWETHFWDWWGAANPGKLETVFLLNAQLQRECQLANYPNLRMYVQPGGNAYDQQHTGIKSTGKANILSFINKGKGHTYIGTCAGWFVTTKDYWWQGQHFRWVAA